MVEKAELAHAASGGQKIIVVQEEVSFAKNVIRGFAFTLGTVLAFAALALLFGKRW